MKIGTMPPRYFPHFYLNTVFKIFNFHFLLDFKFCEKDFGGAVSAQRIRLTTPSLKPPR